MSPPLPSSPDPLVQKVCNHDHTFHRFGEQHPHTERHSNRREASSEAIERPRQDDHAYAEDLNEKITIPPSMSDGESIRRSSGSQVSSRLVRPLKHDILALVSFLSSFI